MPSLRSSPWIRGAPHKRIGDAHFPDKLANLCGHSRPSATRSRLPAPVRSEAGTMPANNGVRLDDRQRIANFREHPIETNEYHSVDDAEGEFPWSTPPQNVYRSEERRVGKECRSRWS